MRKALVFGDHLRAQQQQGCRDLETQQHHDRGGQRAVTLSLAEGPACTRAPKNQDTWSRLGDKVSAIDLNLSMRI